MTIEADRARAHPPVRLAAIAYLGTIAFGLFAEVIARGPVDASDPGSTAAAIMGDGTLYRLGIASDLAMLVCYLVVTAVFYAAFRPSSRVISGMAALFSLTGIAVLAAGLVNLAAPLAVLPSLPAAASVAQAEAVATFLRLHGSGYTISLVFFGVYCLLIGWLVIRSRLLPAVVGLLMAFAGACYLLNSIRVLMDIPLPGGLAGYLLLPGLVGEGAISLWLLAKGLNKAAWNRLHGNP